MSERYAHVFARTDMIVVGHERASGGDAGRW
jgi:hypothetical protein